MSSENLRKPQRIIIPKGVVNPHETTVIEVPTRLQKNPVVIARNSRPVSRNRSKSSVTQSTYKTDYTGFDPTKSKIVFAPSTNTQTSSTQLLGYSNFRPISSSESTRIKADNLDEVELNEKMMLEKDLQEFQRARRKLLDDARLITAKSNLNLKSDACSTSSCVLRILRPKCGTLSNDEDDDSDEVSLIKPYKYKHVKTVCPLERSSGSKRKEKQMIPPCLSKEKIDDCFQCCRKI